MKILHVNFFFHPIVNPRSIRWLHFLRCLESDGHQVDVLTGRPGRGFGTYFSGAEKEIPRGINVYRTFPGFIHYIQYELLASKESIEAKVDSPSRKNPEIKTFSYWIRKIFLHLYRAVLRDLMIPDPFIDWLLFAFIKGLKISLNRKGYDIIISSGVPFTDNIVAYCLKYFNKKSIWIADYGDPWSFYIYPPKPKFVIWANKILEWTTLKKADFVLVTTEETRDGFLKHFPWLRQNRVITIPQGVDVESVRNIPEKQREKFTIGYIGTIFEIREPKSLFLAIRNLKAQNEEIDFLVVGSVHDYYLEFTRNMDFGHHIHFLGKKPHREALEIAKSCHVLIYLGNISEYQLPSKIWEYLAFCKPILAIQKIKGDIGCRIIREHHRGIIVEDNPEAIAEGILYLKQIWIKGQYQKEFKLDFPQKLDWSDRVKALKAIIREQV